MDDPTCHGRPPPKSNEALPRVLCGVYSNVSGRKDMMAHDMHDGVLASILRFQPPNRCKVSDDQVHPGYRIAMRALLPVR
jgi:hypothetical protein